jgi:predicted nucleotidyltransferase
MKKIVEMIFGSHLYGTHTECSDRDYKGVFKHSLDELILQNAQKSINTTTGGNNSKNSALDTDREIYSLHYFLELAMRGETVALDMLHAPDEFIVENTDIWRYIRSERKRFYTKNLTAYVGYCRKQAAKYSIKGSRLHAIKQVVEFLNSIGDKEKRLSEFFPGVEENEHIVKRELKNCTQEDNRALDVCGKMFMVSSQVSYILPILEKMYESYGSRAKLAEKNEGIDWKAISHAYRAGLQLKEIYTTGDLIFPLKDADFLREIKKGSLHFKNDGIGEGLGSLIDEIFSLAESSEYPQRVDRVLWDQFLLNIYK